METTKKLFIEADTIEELADEFMRAVARVGTVSVQDSKGGKPYGKLLMPGGGLSGFQPSYQLDWPEGIIVNGKVPTAANLTVVFSNLTTATNRKAVEKAQAATILGDIARLQEKARRMGLEVPAAGDGE